MPAVSAEVLRAGPLARGVRRAASLLTSRPARGVLLGLALVQLARLAGSLAPPDLYGKDFRQEYCLARALARRQSSLRVGRRAVTAIHRQRARAAPRADPPPAVGGDPLRAPGPTSVPRRDGGLVLRVAPRVAATCQDKMLNLSLYGLIVRHTVGYSFVRPLFAAQTGRAGRRDRAAPRARAGGRVRQPSKSGRVRPPWSVLVVAMLLGSPVTWPMSCVLLLLPIAVFARGFLERRPFVGRLGARHVLVLVGVVIPADTLMSAAAGLAAVGGWVPGAPLPGAAALVLSLPNLALLLAFGIVCGALVRAAAAGPLTSPLR